MSLSILGISLLIFVLCFSLEKTFPGWKLPQVKTWGWRVLLLNAAQLGVINLAEFTWEAWLQGASLFKMKSQLPDVVGALFAYFAATFIFYWWHRLRHQSDVFWRLFHQIHHSPQRLEVITSFYKHPLEMVVNSIIGSVLVFPVLGLSLEAASLYTLLTAVGEFFYHTNINSPQWIGYIFQRPEMHRIHHEYGKHRSNYGDIVWWDMLFGTYENPKEFNATCGFDTEKELKLSEMLAWEDVHEESREPA